MTGANSYINSMTRAFLDCFHYIDTAGIYLRDYSSKNWLPSLFEFLISCDALLLFSMRG